MKIWKIEGYEGLNLIYERELKLGYFSENKIQDLLKALAASADLTSDEIVGAYARRRTKIANELLQIRRDGPRQCYSCGENPHFTARVIEKK